MRIIGILLVVLIVAILINRQLGSEPDERRTEGLELSTDPAAPKVPTNPGDVDQFGKDMQEYLDEQAEQRAEAIREAEDG